MHNLQLIGQCELFKHIIDIVWCSHMKNMFASTLLYVCVTAGIFFLLE